MLQPSQLLAAACSNALLCVLPVHVRMGQFVAEVPVLMTTPLI